MASQMHGNDAKIVCSMCPCPSNTIRRDARFAQSVVEEGDGDEALEEEGEEDTVDGDSPAEDSEDVGLGPTDANTQDGQQANEGRLETLGVWEGQEWEEEWEEEDMALI
jgi:hypothetical protein